MSNLLNSGISISLTERDAAKADTITNVLVGEPFTEDITDPVSLFETRTGYTMAIPKGDAHVWTGGTVRLGSDTTDWHVVGTFTEGIDALIPLAWNRKVKIERRTKRPTGAMLYWALSSTTDEEGGVYAVYETPVACTGCLVQTDDDSDYLVQGIAQNRVYTLLTEDVQGAAIGDGFSGASETAPQWRVISSIRRETPYASWWELKVEEDFSLADMTPEPSPTPAPDPEPDPELQPEGGAADDPV